MGARADMRRFDNLSPPIRKALRNALFDIAASTVNVDVDPKLEVNQIRRRCKGHAEKTRIEVWGEGYPK